MAARGQNDRIDDLHCNIYNFPRCPMRTNQQLNYCGDPQITINGNKA